MSHDITPSEIRLTSNDINAAIVNLDAAVCLLESHRSGKKPLTGDQLNAVIESIRDTADDLEFEWLDVTISLINDACVTVQHRFMIKAKSVRDPAALDDILSNDLERAADAFLQLVIDWRYINSVEDEPLPMSRDNVRIFLDNYPNVAPAVVRALSGDCHE